MGITIKPKNTEAPGAIKTLCTTNCAPLKKAPCGCTAKTNCNEPACCPIKTRVKDCHIFRGLEVERSFKFSTGECNNNAYYVTSCVELHIRRRGCCHVLLVETAYKQGLNGAVWFRWSDAFKALSDGYYEADVYQANKTCASICLYLAPCADRVQTDEIILMQDCGTSTCLEVDQTALDEPTTTGCPTC